MQLFSSVLQINDFALFLAFTSCIIPSKVEKFRGVNTKIPFTLVLGTNDTDDFQKVENSFWI